MSFSLSLPGVIGAGVGLFVGHLDYLIAKGYLAKRWAAKGSEPAPDMRRRIEWGLRIGLTGGIGLIGYLFGASIGGG